MSTPTSALANAVIGGNQPQQPTPQPAIHELPEVQSAMKQMLIKHADPDDRSESTVVMHGYTPEGKPVLRQAEDTGDYMHEKFSLWPGDRAIIHTHPPLSIPDPSDQDKAVADKYGVKMYSVSSRGLYLYDPATKQTSQVYKGTDYLKGVKAAK